jgi:hypothetical protein
MTSSVKNPFVNFTKGFFFRAYLLEASAELDERIKMSVMPSFLNEK